ncbi:MAG TPA: molybdopterin-synthase adenylyltransferase MoeB [Arenimonas sp.]|uniref:molybdopterin-synthase adenylyltransferase MoeB n=1 Tax=Arenimonas sp. TaxID=1872635 RepID=UPI002C6B92C7|nr:molybdopterin-synthase adenylyltransferase MoeB [Arenimonas sp.]HMB57466.1 molybdopterin-synthase adenylyltransferase MoeB [Arenimonas sp.]
MTQSIREITPAEALQLQKKGAPLIDVREADEHALGLPEAAAPVPRARLEADPAQYHPDQTQALLLICAGGRRSLLAAESLASQGYRQLYSVIGGFQRWQAEGLPIASSESPDFLQRYARHLRLPQVGVSGQKKLAAARVLIVGAGGLGSPAAYYLAAAGVGFLRVVDDDRVELSNLQRQILHTDDRVGQLKVDSAKQTLSALNPKIEIEAIATRLAADNVEALIGDVDVVVDGADNFTARYLLSDACVQLAKPLVYGAVHRFEGQVSVFDAGRQRGSAPCYRCLFPDPPSAAEAPNCSEAGVLGVLPGLIGLLQATETLKLLLQIGEPLIGRLLHVETLGMQFRETRLKPDPACRRCAPGRVALPYDEVVAFCADGH